MKTLSLQKKFISIPLAEAFIIQAEPFDVQMMCHKFSDTFNKDEFNVFIKLLKLNETIPPFFNQIGQMGESETDVSKVVQIVQTMVGVQLEPGKLYYTNGSILTNNQLLI